jgi:sulfide:quinone oxidoreductase
MPAEPPLRHVLVAGGGPGALEAVLALKDLAAERVAVTVLAPERHFTYRPLSVGEAFGSSAACRYELAALVREAGAVLVRDAVDAVETTARRVITQDRALLDYDALILALGARARVAVPGAIPFRGSRDSARVADALRELAARPLGRPARIVFAAPMGATWTLPLYELALMTATWAGSAGLDVELTLTTPEAAPLAVFGPEVGEAVGALLEQRGVRLRTNALAERADEGRLWLTLDSPLPADVVVALPRLFGPALPGVPADRDGFVEVDAFGRVEGCPDMYALGDMTADPVKQGGLATLQADAVASAVAAWAGASVSPEPVQRVLRALLLTGGAPLWLRHPAPAGAEAVSVGDGPAWWPAHKIAGRRLAPWLAAREHLCEQPTVQTSGGLALNAL